jgi:hypothetical protein
VRQVDQVHDAEHQRQARGQQEQHHAELQPVERLFGDENQFMSKKKGAVVRALDASSAGYHFILQSLA